MDGKFTVAGKGFLGTLIEYEIPFEIKMWIEKAKDKFKGSYTLTANPIINKPALTKVCQSPGIFGLFPAGRCCFQSDPKEKKVFHWDPKDDSTLIMLDTVISKIDKKGGVLEVTQHGNDWMTVRFVDMPGKFSVFATAIHDLSDDIIGEYRFDFGFFSKDSPKHMDSISLQFSRKILGFQQTFNDQAEMRYPKNGTTTLRGVAIIRKTESFYSVVEAGGTHYVEQVSEVEAARQLFLEHPELLEKIQAAARAEIRRGKAKGEDLVAPHYVAELDKLEQKEGVPTTAGTSHPKVVKPAAGEEKPTAIPTTSRPFEGLVYAIEQLIAQGKDGYNACLLVVGGCWISISFKPKRKQLYIQVAGDKYIPKKSALKPEHVKKLETMRIKREDGSIDIFSIHHDVATIDIPQIVQNVFQIFDEVLRVSKGAVAYLQYDLVPKPTPEYEAVLATLAQFIPDRREKKKFYWRWGTS
ncbi:MAG: hypothetical protein JW839_06605 [Candidatus Lokiarchaeota archaeon]|nr:hypothetical protein [Candidatus Lokiarchaeota archaeon]